MILNELQEKSVKAQRYTDTNGNEYRWVLVGDTYRLQRVAIEGDTAKGTLKSTIIRIND